MRKMLLDILSNVSNGVWSDSTKVRSRAQSSGMCARGSIEPLPGTGLTWICELDISTRCMDLGGDPRDVRGASNGSVR